MIIDDLFNKYTENGNELQNSILINNFKELYKLPILKTGLDLILSEMEIGNLTFNLNIVDERIQLRGCCLTHEKRIYNKIFKGFVKTFKHKITLQKLNVGVLMHEMAHSLEKQGRIPLSQGFMQAIENDLRNFSSASHTVRYAIEKIMYKDLSLYPPEQHPSELFARYFQMLAMSKEVGHFDDDFQFKASDCENFFQNTTMWINNIFNSAIAARVTEYIASHSSKFTQKFTTQTNEKSWAIKKNPRIKSNFEE